MYNGFDHVSGADDVGRSSRTGEEPPCPAGLHQEPDEAADAGQGRVGEPVRQSLGEYPL